MVKDHWHKRWKKKKKKEKKKRDTGLWPLDCSRVEKVLFSDEIQQFVPRHTHSRRPLGNHFDKKYDVATMKHPPSQMILGSTSCRGAAGLISFCLTPLWTNPSMWYCSKRRWNYTCTSIAARSKVATVFLKKNKIYVLDWPGHSPDLNIYCICYSPGLSAIENLWTIMKDMMACKQPWCAEYLRQGIKEVWATEITQENCESLVSSMPRRIQAVIDSKLGHTKYWKIVTLKLWDVIKFEIVLYYVFGEINVYNLVWRPKIKITVLSILLNKLCLYSLYKEEDNI